MSPVASPAVGGSLIAFIIVYFSVFGFGVLYLLRLMGKPPQAHEPAPAAAAPTHAGITPAVGVKKKPS